MRIGVLEDDMVQQGLYKLWFATAGYSCACYGTAEAFERALGQENFDLLIIDWMLPDSTGEVVVPEKFISEPRRSVLTAH